MSTPCSDFSEKTNLECGEHLTLLLAVDQTVVILHGDERSEVVRDGVFCDAVSDGKSARSGMGLTLHLVDYVTKADCQHQLERLRRKKYLHWYA